MKKFVKNTCLSIFLFLLFILVFEWGTSKIVQDRLEYRVHKATTSIILGHSQPECAYNDSILVGFTNISRSAEPYFYTYYKLKVIIENNPEVNRVFLEFSNNYLEKEIEAWTWRSDLLTNYYPDLSSVITFSDKWRLLRKDPQSFILASSLASRYRLQQLINMNFDHSGEWGGYKYLVRNKTDSLLQHHEISLKTLATPPGDNLNIQYLKKIKEYLEKQKVKLYLIRSPLHKRYEGYAYEKEFQYILDTKFPETPFLDFSKFPLQNDEFADLKHLNHKGSKIFSVWFQDLIDKEMLQKLPAQEFIDSEIDSLNRGNKSF